MKNILYMDCFSGISGDMMVGAFIDAGMDISHLSKEIKKLGLKGYEVRAKKVMAGAVSASKFEVEIVKKQKPRNYRDIKKIITASSLPDIVKRISIDIFESIAFAEGKIHEQDVEEVHFHEVGAVDSIIDIVGTAIAIKYFKIDEIYCSLIPVGSGSIDTSHGKLPVPAPATLEILKSIPIYQGDFDFEVTTPTGAAIVKTLAHEFGKIPEIEIKNTGYGAGTKNVFTDEKHLHKDHNLPNVLRILIGRKSNIAHGKGSLHSNSLGKSGYKEDTVILSTNIDDSTPETMGHVIEKLNKMKGVLDAWIENIYMKKNRPAFKLSAICTIKEERNIAEIIFKETSTLGIRRETVNRYCLEREKQILRLPYGEVEIKIAKLYGEIVNCLPEYESCRKLAKKTGKALKDIYRDTDLFLSKR